MRKRTLEEWSIFLSGAARPIRLWVELILIIIISLVTLWTGGRGDSGGILMTIVIGIFADFGVTGISKTMEKRTKMKVDGTQKVIETATDPNTNTTIENINAGNETVNVNKKPQSEI